MRLEGVCRDTLSARDQRRWPLHVSVATSPRCTICLDGWDEVTPHPAAHDRHPLPSERAEKLLVPIGGLKHILRSTLPRFVIGRFANECEENCCRGSAELDLMYALGRRPGNTKIQVRNSFPSSREVQNATGWSPAR